MIQGETLNAELAECGDIFTPPGLSEVLTAYVILSRVKNATGLLLLRAFSPVLFQMGPPPGPLSVLTWLRQRFRTLDEPTTAEELNSAHAVEQYTELSRSWELQRTKIKCDGLLWRCWHCTNDFPAEGYGAKPNNKDDVHRLCLAQGEVSVCL